VLVAHPLDISSFASHLAHFLGRNGASYGVDKSQLKDLVTSQSLVRDTKHNRTVVFVGYADGSDVNVFSGEPVGGGLKVLVRWQRRRYWLDAADCEATETPKASKVRGKVLIGVVHQGEVRAASVTGDREDNHTKHFGKYNPAERWRYDGKGVVVWWDYPKDDDKFAVEDYLARSGGQSFRHTIVTNQNFYATHPKIKQSESIVIGMTNEKIAQSVVESLLGEDEYYEPKPKPAPSRDEVDDAINALLKPWVDEHIGDSVTAWSHLGGEEIGMRYREYKHQCDKSEWEDVAHGLTKHLEEQGYTGYEVYSLSTRGFLLRKASTSEALIAEYDLAGSGGSSEPEYLEGVDIGDIVEVDGEQFVAIDGITRGGATMWFVSLAKGGLYYAGEDPSEPSDGMSVDDPYASAELLSGEFKVVGKADEHTMNRIDNSFPGVTWSDTDGDGDE